jgi:hypothetical protein
MSGTQEDSSRSLMILREDASTGLASACSPVLGGLSETELDAIVSQLRTDKNLTLAPAGAARERWGALTEQLLLSTPGVLGLHESEVAREEAARQAWHIALDERVQGPLDISALRAHWERGELGPDSLCWRKGFTGWHRVCQVPGLAEFLAPRPANTPSSAEELVPDPRADALDFPLRGAEALRILAEDVPPPLPSKQPASLPPVLEPEPVTAPVLEPEPDTLPEAPQARDAAGAHPILPTQVEVHLRGGAWLALGGGIVGGMLVAVVLWLLGLTGALGMSSRGPSSQEATSADTAGATASATTPKPTAAAAATPGTAALPTSMAPKTDATALVPAIGADSTRALAPGVDSSRALASGSDSTRVPALGANPGRASALGADSVRVPAIGAGSSLSGAASSLKPAPAPTPLPKPMPLETEAVAAPQRATAPVRPVLPDPPMQKLAKAEVSAQTDGLAERRVASQTGRVEEDEDEDLGLDEEFERELDNPAKRATPPKRTVWVPPAPQMVEPAVSLSQSDIFSVVVSNKGDITSCVSAQKLQSEEGNRRVVVRWNILPSGKVTEVFTETAGYQGTPLALCLEGKIRSWSFPKHREQGSPVRFPFVF